MRYSLINIVLFIAYTIAQNIDYSNYCWSEELGYECCSDNITVDSFPDKISDSNGYWAIIDGVKCGIRDGRCWSKAYKEGYPCCRNGTIPTNSDINGQWGENDGETCGILNPVIRWNDRERVTETKEEWNAFKKEWNTYKNNFERISVFPGDNETELNFGWYSTTNTLPIICWGDEETLSKCTNYTGSIEKHYSVNNIQYYSNKVTVKGIQRNSVYYYKRYLNGVDENDIIKFTTHDSKNFKFIFVGDPQIGGAHDRYSPANYYMEKLSVDDGTRNDAFNWNRTIISAFNFTHQQPSLLLSAGDQADEEDKDKPYNEEIQYSAFLLPKQMQQIPVAAALGNHDNISQNFRFHFNPPNPLKEPTYYSKKTGYITGYNYFFKYNNVLVVVLESNHDTCADFKKIIVNGINKYPNTEWRIAMFHHDIYGNGVTHAHTDNIIKKNRPCLTKLLHGYKFDVVINGHDHVYTASKFISYDENANTKKYKVYEVKDNEVNKDPKGPLYITANCSTGAKLYEYLNSEVDYVHKNLQTYTSTFGILDFYEETDGVVSLSITSYDVETHIVTDGPYIIEKQKK
ncbi:Non-catalytic module family DOC2, partial [Piromyces sp. E2]